MKQTLFILAIAAMFPSCHANDVDQPTVEKMVAALQEQAAAMESSQKAMQATEKAMNAQLVQLDDLHKKHDGAASLRELHQFQLTCTTAAAVEIGANLPKTSMLCQVAGSTSCVRYGDSTLTTTTGVQYGDPANCKGGWNFPVNVQNGWCRGQTADQVVDCLYAR